MKLPSFLDEGGHDGMNRIEEQIMLQNQEVRIMRGKAISMILSTIECCKIILFGASEFLILGWLKNVHK